MISHAAFSRLRVTDYLAEDDICVSDDWRFLGRRWLCLGSGFTDFLSRPDKPEDTRCISINFEDLPHAPLARLLRDLDLPLSPGMDLREVKQALGEPTHSTSFVADRASHEFKVGGFTVDVTLLNDGGLTYFVVYPPLPPENIPDEYSAGEE